jgi:hypothetical protein
MNSQISCPIYDGKETINQYLKRITQYQDQLKKKNYDIILKYINLWLIPYNIKLKSLIDFKNITDDKLETHSDHNKNFLKLKSKNICTELSIENIIDEKIDEKDLSIHRIISFFRTVLKTIDYSLIRKNIGNNFYYLIINKPVNIKY